MIPSQTFESFPVFSDTGTKVKPGDAKYSAGFQQSDVLPAEWVNWEWNKASKGVTDLNTGLTSVEAEINSVLTGAGKSPDATKTNQLYQSIAKLIDDAESRAKLAAHPIGSLYWSSDSTDPGQLFGGTWSQIKDCFVWAKGDSDTVNATGGAKTVTLQEANLPSHSHTFTPAGSISGGVYKFTGTEHSHTYTPAGSIGSNGSWYFYTRRIDTGDECIFAPGSKSSNITINTVSPDADGVNGRRVGYSGSGNYNYSKITCAAHGHTFTGTQATLKATQGGSISITTNPTFTGSASDTGYTGSGTAVNVMNPHIVKYCWERTA